jgi:putative oxidoreductase
MANQTHLEPSSRRVDHVGHSGVHPVSGPWPAGNAPLVEQGQLGHPEQRRTAAAMLSSLNSPGVNLGFARAIFGGYFLYNAANHFMNRQTMTEYARSKNVPLPGLAVLGSGALLALGGLSLLTGIRPTMGASFITAFLAGVSPLMHRFWAVGDEQRMAEMTNFAKNVALIGGACFAAALPQPWPGSVPLTGRHESTALTTTR